MIKCTILYPNEAGKRFDFGYYQNNHMVTVDKSLKPYGLLGSGIEKGVAGGEPGAPAPFICTGWMTFGSINEFQKAFAEKSEMLLADLPNFTDIAPQIQISEVIK